MSVCSKPLSKDCKRCTLEWISGEGGLSPCFECGTRHLKKHMIEKLEGYHCRWCAEIYEFHLLGNHEASA